MEPHQKGTALRKLAMTAGAATLAIALTACDGNTKRASSTQPPVPARQTTAATQQSMQPSVAAMPPCNVSAWAYTQQPPRVSYDTLPAKK